MSLSESGQAGTVFQGSQEVKDYLAWYKTPFGKYAHGAEVEATLKLLGNLEGKIVLDVGCGPGLYFSLLAQKGASVVGIDPSLEMLKTALEGTREHENIIYVLGRAEDLPFRNGTFDAVLSVTSLCFVSSPKIAVAETRRVLREGGIIVVGVLNALSPYCLQKKIGSRIRESSYRSATFFTASQMRQLFGGGVWFSTVLAQEWMPMWLLQLFKRWEPRFAKVLRPLGAFIVGVVARS